MEEEHKKSLAEANVHDTSKVDTPSANERKKSAGAGEQIKQDQKPQVSDVKNQEQQKVQKAEATGLPAKTPELRKQEKIQSKKKRSIKRLFSKVGLAKPSSLKAKLDHYWFEYSRVLHLTRKPTRQEYKELAIMVIIGTLLIGGIGFVVQVFFQYI